MGDRRSKYDGKSLSLILLGSFGFGGLAVRGELDQHMLVDQVASVLGARDEAPHEHNELEEVVPGKQ